MKIPIEQLPSLVGKNTTFFGSLIKRRDHGKIIFLDLEDQSGIIQVVVAPGSGAYKTADSLRPGYLLQVQGKVLKRPRGMENPKLTTGKVEIVAEKIEIVRNSPVLPFSIENDGRDIDESLRLKYRYLDLRRKRLRQNLSMRGKFIKKIRDYLEKDGFLEIETPILTKSTPEGARDYLVPSRQQPGKFYALPQSPQQYKQLLMVAGLEKYFQIAHIFRDEDPRADRQPEFTQLDLEMSFMDQKDILDLVEKLLVSTVKDIFPGKKFTLLPFPRLKYRDVMKRYKTDRPDLRKNKKNKDELAFTWILDWPLFSWNKKEKKLDPNHHIFTAPKEEDIAKLDPAPLKVQSMQHDLVLNGEEVGGGSLRITDPKVQEKIFELVGINKKEAKEKFGHLLEALSFAAPPHGGWAGGLDRILMVLLGEENIREVIAFPKTGDGQDLMMNSPSLVSESQLKELKIKITK